MCGIAGFGQLSDPVRDETLLQGMGRTLSHRGPDGEGFWTSDDGTTGLAHTRLAIIDLDHGDQPMKAIDGRYVAVFNGEIYNYQALRSELEGLGHRFGTHSDTEVVLEAFRRWGEGCLSRFNGMYAFALYDTLEKELFLARDPTGIKPLYIHHGSDGFFFGSEIKALLNVPGIPRRLDHHALTDFLVLGYPMAPRTLFRDIQEMEPGTWFRLNRGGLEKGRFWAWARKPEQWDAREAETRTEEALIESVRDHLVSDVPVGAFLSGGIDSSLIVAFARRILGKPLDTFNVAFENQGFDESPQARQVAASLGTNHHEIRISNDRCDVELISEVLSQFDQPFGDSSAIPSFLICEEIRKYVKVALSGDGGDEMFGGYRRFWYADVASRLSRVSGVVDLGSRLSAPLVKRIRPEAYRSTRRLFKAAGESLEDRLVTIACYSHPDELRQMLNPEIFGGLGGYRPRFACDPGTAYEASQLDATVRYVLPGDYLRKVDFMSSAHGLEVRVPMLGAQVLDHAATLPTHLRYDFRQNKILLRRIAKRYLPEEISRMPKAGFEIPLDSWLGDHGRRLFHERLTKPDSQVRKLIDPGYLELVANTFLDPEQSLERFSRYNICHRAYMLWSLEGWLDRWKPEI